MARHRWWADLVCCVLLVVVSVWFVSWYFPTYYVPRPVPTNPHFGAAVTVAFGEGLKDPILEPQTKLAGFLNHSVPSRLSFEDVTHPIAAAEISSYQRQHLYLMTLVGLCWRVFGVDWAALGPLVGVMAAISVLCVYGILRSRARPLVALLGAAALLACPAQLALANYVRDYAKTPFFLMVFYLFSILLTRSLNGRKLMAVGAALGMVTGLGAGIRQDIQIVWAVIPFIYLFGLPTGLWKMPWARLGSLSLALVLFLAISYPTRNNEYNYTAHSVLGGAFKYNHDSMGMGGAPYVWFHETQMTDNYTNTVIQDYNRRLTGERVDVRYLGTEYERAGHALVLDLIKSFPADFVTRFLAASLTTIRDAPWLTVGVVPTMYDVDDQFIRDAQRAETRVRQTWNMYGPWLVFFGLCLVSWYSLRVAILTTGLLIFFTGYTSLQFQPRHLWHLGVVFVCVTAFLLDEALRVLTLLFRVVTGRQQITGTSFSKTNCKNVVMYLVLVALGLAATVAGSRLYQSREMRELYDKYAVAQLLSSTIVGSETTTDGARLIHVKPAPKQGETDVRFRYDVLYHALRIDGNELQRVTIRVADENLEVINIGERIGASVQGPVTVFFPALNRATPLDIEIRGLEQSSSVSMSTVARPDEFPLSMVLVLPRDSRELLTHNVFIPHKRLDM